WLVTFGLLSCAGSTSRSTPSVRPVSPAHAEVTMTPDSSTPVTSPTEEVLFGQRVRDAHRWLENGKEPSVVRWLDEQDARARTVLEALPERDSFVQRLKELVYVERQGVPKKR